MTTMLTGQARRVGTGGMEGLEEMSFENPLVYWIALGIAGLIFGIGAWVGAVNADRRSFKEFMTEVRDDLKKILARLPPRVFAGESPIELTDLGKNISTKDGPKWMAIYIGETDSFKNCLGGDHEKWDRALRYGMTHVHAHTGSTSRDVRRREEADLLAILNPPCND